MRLNNLADANARIRYLYQSIQDLNETLKKVDKTTVENLLSNSEVVDKHMPDVIKILKSINDELKCVNINLQRLRTNTGLIGIALNGGVDEVLAPLCKEIDALNNKITELMNCNGGEKNGK